MIWFVVIQQRAQYNGRLPQDDFRGYRKYSVWPKVFKTCADCDAFIRECFTFKNLTGHKMSASSMNQVQLRNVTGHYGHRRRDV